MINTEPEYKIYFYFSFLLTGINFPDNVEGVDEVNKVINSINEFGKKGITKFEIQCGEHWEDPLVVRRHLWLFSSHISYKKKFEKDALNNLFSGWAEIAKLELFISSVFGGISGADLLITFKSESPFKDIVDKIDEIVGVKENTIDKFSVMLNNFFIDEILEYIDTLNKLDDLKYDKREIRWDEFSTEKIKDVTGNSEETKKYTWIAGMNSENVYKEIEPRREEWNEEKVSYPFYQQPYITVMIKGKDIDVDEYMKSFLG